jgi:hypothetical protein
MTVAHAPQVYTRYRTPYSSVLPFRSLTPRANTSSVALPRAHAGPKHIARPMAYQPKNVTNVLLRLVLAIGYPLVMETTPMTETIIVNGQSVPKTNRTLFFATYGEQLALALVSHPAEYAWPAANLPVVLARMTDSFIRGCYNKDSRAIKATCKILDIKHTYSAINSFLAESTPHQPLSSGPIGV